MNNKEIGKCSCLTCSKVSYLKVFPLAYSKFYKCSMRMLVHLPLLHHPLLVCFSGNFSMSLYQCIQALGRIKHMTKRINICLFRAHNLLALLVRVVQKIVSLPLPHIGGQQGGTVPGVAGVVGLHTNIIQYKYTIRSIVCKASCHSVTRSLGHPVTRSLGLLVTWSHPSNHVFIFFDMAKTDKQTNGQIDKRTNNIRVYRFALQTIKIQYQLEGGPSPSL